LAQVRLKMRWRWSNGSVDSKRRSEAFPPPVEVRLTVWGALGGWLRLKVFTTAAGQIYRLIPMPFFCCSGGGGNPGM
jgi:hypothetical protein